MIRFHDKNFSKTGDCSFPSLKNSKVWKNISIDESKLLEVLQNLSYFKISKILSADKSVYIWLDRTFAIDKYFQQYQNLVIEHKIDIKTEVGDIDDLTSCRVKMFSQMLDQYLKRTPCATNEYILGLKNINHQESSSGNYDLNSFLDKVMLHRKINTCELF